MLPQDKHRIVKLRKRLAFSILVSFCLVYWIIQIGRNVESIESENLMLNNDLLEMQSQVDSLKQKIHSIEQPKIVKNETIKKILKPKKEKTPDLIDTIKIENKEVTNAEIQESMNEIPSDTLNR